MNGFHIRPRVGFCLSLTIFYLVILTSGCGGDSANSNHTSSDIGYIRISLAFEAPATSFDNYLAKSPSGDVCEDYLIDEINAYVYDASNALVASQTAECSSHQMEITCPAGSGMILFLEASTTASESAQWSKRFMDIAISPNEELAMGKVTLDYIGDDQDPPQIVSFTPDDGATNVPADSVITATFNEDVVPYSAEDSIELFGSDDVVGTATYDIGTQTVTFVPDSNLDPAVTYTAKITMNVEDRAGNAMTADWTWDFTTAADDQDPPQIVSFTPDDGATNVPVDSVITATFNEDVVPYSAEGSIELFGLDNVVGTATYDIDTRTVTFVPDSNLDPAVTYTAKITMGVEDLAGNTMAEEFMWSFTTPSEPETVRLDMNTLPEAEGWGFYDCDGASSASISGGVLTIESPSCYEYKAPSHWIDNVDNANGWVIETRMRVDPATVDESFPSLMIWIEDNTNCVQIGFQKDRVYIAYPTNVNYLMDTTAAFRTYRIEGQNQSVKLYVDNSLVIDYTHPGTGGCSHVLFFGDGVGGSYSKSYWDYFFYTIY